VGTFLSLFFPYPLFPVSYILFLNNFVLVTHYKGLYVQC